METCWYTCTHVRVIFLSLPVSSHLPAFSYFNFWNVKKQIWLSKRTQTFIFESSHNNSSIPFLFNFLSLKVIGRIYIRQTKICGNLLAHMYTSQGHILVTSSLLTSSSLSLFHFLFLKKLIFFIKKKKKQKIEFIENITSLFVAFQSLNLNSLISSLFIF